MLQFSKLPAMRLSPYRRIILWIEFIALIVLLGSVFLFSRASGGTSIAPSLWLIPILASLLVISGFSANLHIRWIENPDTQVATATQKAFVYVVILSLYAVWFIAIARAWQVS